MFYWRLWISCLNFVGCSILHIKVFHEIDKWPTEWKVFLQTVSSVEELKDILTLSSKNDLSKVPVFVQTFVKRRNVIKDCLMDLIFEKEDSDLGNLEIPGDLRRGMTPKKQHEVSMFSQHIREQVKDKRFSSMLGTLVFILMLFELNKSNNSRNFLC